MFIPENGIDSIAFRGAVAKTKTVPKVQTENTGSITISKFVIDNISSALIAEKKSILGARVIIPKEMVDINVLKTWDVRFQSMLMDVSKSLNAVDTDVLKKGFESYYDVAWMIGNDNEQQSKIEKYIVRYWEKSIFSDRASLHASATRLLYQACEVKKKSVITALHLLYNGQRKGGLISDTIKVSDDFEKWMIISKIIKRNRNNILEILP
jgi:hypothetical protein